MNVSPCSWHQPYTSGTGTLGSRCRIAHRHCPSAIEILWPYFTQRFTAGNGTGSGFIKLVVGPAAWRTSAGEGKAVLPLTKKLESVKDMFWAEGSMEDRRYGPSVMRDEAIWRMSRTSSVIVMWVKSSTTQSVTSGQFLIVRLDSRVWNEFTSRMGFWGRSYTSAVPRYTIFLWMVI